MGSSGTTTPGEVVRRGFTEEEIEAVRQNRGRLPRHEYLRLRVRYFTDGAILGTKAFVESVFQARRAWFSPGRKTAARPLRGLDRSDLAALGQSAQGQAAGVMRQPMGDGRGAAPGWGVLAGTAKRGSSVTRMSGSQLLRA